MLQGSAWSLYSVQVDASSNTGMFLSSVGKCRTAKVNNKLTSSFLLTEEIHDGNFSIIDWGLRWRLHVSCTCVWMAQTIFRRQRKHEGWWSPRLSMHSCYQWQHWKSARRDSKRPKVGCSSSSWGSQFGQGNCSTNSKGRIEHEKGLCKNGSTTTVRWTKRMSQGIVFRPFATHWEWTGLVEFDK